MDTLPCLYRFALLLKGSPQQALEALESVFNHFAPQLCQFRQPKQRCAFIVRKLREHKPAPVESSVEPVLDRELFALVERFAGLPEPARSALALFYSELFSPAEAADVLTMSLEDYSQALTLARTLLAGSAPLAS